MPRPTCNSQRINGHPVVLVLLVGIGAPKAKSGQECGKKVCDEADDTKSRSSSDVASTMCSPASGNGFSTERQRCGFTFLDACNEKAFSEATRLDPVGGTNRGQQQDNGDGTTGKGYDLKRIVL